MRERAQPRKEEAAAAGAGDGATVGQLEAHRRALVGHCYRMLGSLAEAEDATQETLVRAWRSLASFQGRSSLRTWLYRIATRVCLDALGRGGRRLRPPSLGPAASIDTLGPLDRLSADRPLPMLPSERWVEPIPDASALPDDADPAELLTLRQSIRLAFVAALQDLPPRQRAALLLTEVLDWPAAAVADNLETSVAAVNSALQRARATLAARHGRDADVDVHGPAGTADPIDPALLSRYVDAFERYDMDALASLLRDDAVMSMPPIALWMQGPRRIRDWLLGPGAGCRGSRLVPTAACGLPAFGQYRPGPGPAAAGSPRATHHAWSLIVLEPAGDRIAGLNHFLDVERLFPRFGLPPYLTA